MTSPAPVLGSPTSLQPGSRRRPYPFDLYINTTKFGAGGVRAMLEPDKDGNIVSESVKTLEATAPLDYTYSSANPFKERTSEFQKLFGGFGQATAPDGPVRRYSWAEKADLSVDGLWMKGPAFERHVESLTAGAGEVRQLIRALRNGVLTLFAICQAGVYRQDYGTNTWVNDMSPGAGVFCQQAVRFKHRGATPIDALYVTNSAGVLWRLNGAGTVWESANHTTTGPILPAEEAASSIVGPAQYIERVGDELWIGSRTSVMKCEDDPWVPGNWSGSIGTTGNDYTPVGDMSNNITYLRQVDNSLYIFKEDGIYTVDTDGLDHELFPTLRGKDSFYNGKNAAVWLDRIWFSYGDQTFTLSGQGQLKPDGLEQMLENTSDVKGRWIGGAGHNTWFMYEVYYNQQNNRSYLIKHGSWIEESESQDTPGVAQFAEAHHGSLYDWPKRATSVSVVSGLAYGATSEGNDRLYVGFLDGTVQWCVLPQHSPNPATDDHTEFTNQDSYVYLPHHHSQFRADNKLWHAMTVFGPQINTMRYAEIQYRTDITDINAAWETVSPTDPRYTLSGERKNLVEDEVTYPVYGRVIDLRVKLIRHLPEPGDPGYPSDGFTNYTPVLEGIAVHESIRPAFSREFTFLVRMGSYLPRRDGTVDRRLAYQVQQEVLRACATIGPVNILLPTGHVEEMTITSYRDQKFARQNVSDHTWTMEVHAIQLRTITQGAPQHETPPSDVLIYNTLETYTYDELERLI